VKSGHLLTALVAGVSACVGALIASMLFSSTSVERPVSAARMAGGLDVARRAELDDRLNEHGHEMKRLRERIAMLERRPEASARLPLASEFLTAGEPEAAHAQMSSLLDGEPSGNLVASVDAALRQIRADERREAEDRREAAQLDKIDRRLDRLQERLGLSDYQIDEMRDVLRKQDSTRNELLALRKQAEDKELYREGRRALEEETRASLATILTLEQLEAYERAENRGDDRDKKATDKRKRGNDRDQRKRGG